MSTITEVELRIAEVLAQIKAEDARHAEAKDGLRSELGLAAERRALLLDGLDEAKLLLASHVVYKRGRFAMFGDMPELIESARTAILSGGNSLKSEYLGLKDYDRWCGQRSDHSYCMIPRHGSIVFEIGLHRPIRERATDPVLTAEEIEACLYWLGNLNKVQAAEDAGKAESARVKP